MLTFWEITSSEAGPPTWITQKARFISPTSMSYSRLADHCLSWKCVGFSTWSSGSSGAARLHHLAVANQRVGTGSQRKNIPGNPEKAARRSSAFSLIA
jgi:hypothetical protein